MATYKQPCVHCGAYIDGDARYCPQCGSRFPFGYSCPTCLRPVEKNTLCCPGCGRPLYVVCPSCGEKTFVQDKCEHCSADLMVRCPNERCGEMQFFENTKCTACGTKIKNKKKK